MTPIDVAALRTVAEAAPNDGWRVVSAIGSYCHPPIDIELKLAVDTRTPDATASAVGDYVETFDPPTVLALLDEIERLRALVVALADPDGCDWHAEPFAEEGTCRHGFMGPSADEPCPHADAWPYFAPTPEEPS